MRRHFNRSSVYWIFSSEDGITVGAYFKKFKKLALARTYIVSIKIKQRNEDIKSYK